MGFPLYHLETKIERCRIVVKLNDLTIVELTAGATPEWFAPPLNPYLIGDGNLLTIDLWPPPDGSFGDVEVAAIVRRYEKGGIVAPGAGPVVTALDVMRELAERARVAADEGVELEVPQSFMFVFDNEGPRFSAELADAEPFGDEAALRDYAIHLRDLMRAGDAAALAVEMAPKVAAYAAAFDDDPGRIGAGLSDVLVNEYLPRGFETGFERDEVELLPHCGGRVWELSRPGKQPLVQTPTDEDGGSMQIVIFAAPTPDGLRVVR